MVRDERGFTSVWVLILALFVVVLGVAAFDVWRVFSEQRVIAARADAAAAAGAQALDVAAFNDSNGATLVLAPAEAKDLATTRLGDDLGSSVSSCNETDPASGTCVDVSVKNPGVDGVPANAAPSVTVTVRRRVDFSLFPGSQVVVATSTAAPQIAT